MEDQKFPLGILHHSFILRDTQICSNDIVVLASIDINYSTMTNLGDVYQLVRTFKGKYPAKFLYYNKNPA